MESPPEELHDGERDPGVLQLEHPFSLQVPVADAEVLDAQTPRPERGGGAVFDPGLVGVLIDERTEEAGRKEDIRRNEIEQEAAGYDRKEEQTGGPEPAPGTFPHLPVSRKG